MEAIDRSASIIKKTVLMNAFNIPIYYPRMRYMANHLEKYTYDQTYNYCTKVIKAVLNATHVKIKAFGLDNIPTNDGFYLCANHQEKFDPLVIWYTFPRQVGVILNDAACHRPAIREVCALIKTQKLIHNNMHSILTSFNNVTEELKKGFNYLVFPEGAYEREYNKLSTFHTGCFKSPRRAHCPIIPIAIKNSFRIFDKGLHTSKPIEVHYLKPIDYSEYSELSTKDLSLLVQDRIRKELEVPSIY